MGVETFTMVEITSPVAPARLFKALFLDNHNFMPKAVPDFVKNIEFLQGEPNSVGSIKQLNFPDGSPFKYVKNRVDEIDVNNLYFKYTTIEGDVLRDNLECAVYENKFEASGTCKMIAHYHTKGDYVMQAEEIAIGKEQITKLFKACEKYLIDNPQLYA